MIFFLSAHTVVQKFRAILSMYVCICFFILAVVRGWCAYIYDIECTVDAYGKTLGKGKIAIRPFRIQKVKANEAQGKMFCH